jgi:hypothetical protein
MELRILLLKEQSNLKPKSNLFFSNRDMKAETEKAKTETLEFREKEKILQAELMTLMEEEKKMAMLKTKQTQKPPKTPTKPAPLQQTSSKK